MSTPHPVPSALRGLGAAGWMIIPLAFIFCLGGIHPTDGQRDLLLVFSAVLVVLFSAPALVCAFIEGGRSTVAAQRNRALWLAGRVLVQWGLAALVFNFIHGISHGGPR